MYKNIPFAINEDVYEKFCMALSLTNETEDEVIENCMKMYIAKTFEKLSQDYNPSTSRKTSVQSDNDYGKANRRIPMWAAKPSQYNHKIIRAYFKAAEKTGRATITEMEKLCSDKNVPELYVPTFKNNYSQMKMDFANSHGKVFEDDGGTVTIWNEVEATLMKYKESFGG